jgi:hypothetical protein
LLWRLDHLARGVPAAGLSAASGYYGSLVPQFAHEKPKCPTILHFGEHDHGIPMEGVEKVKAAHPEVKVYVYDAGHGFNSDRRADYNPEAAKLARSARSICSARMGGRREKFAANAYSRPPRERGVEKGAKRAENFSGRGSIDAHPRPKLFFSAIAP